MTRKKIEVHYDPALKKYRARCSRCEYYALRSKSEAATHVISQHLAYVHGVQL